MTAYRPVLDGTPVLQVLQVLFYVLLRLACFILLEIAPLLQCYGVKEILTECNAVISTIDSINRRPVT